MRPALIDHAAAFRAEAVVSMTHENAFQTGAVRCVSAQTFLRLRFLDAAALSREFEGVLSEGELAGMSVRRDAVSRPRYRRQHLVMYLGILWHFSRRVYACAAPCCGAS
jgi:hypothetical protein